MSPVRTSRSLRASCHSSTAWPSTICLEKASGFLVIVAHDGNALRETAVGAGEIGVIAGHHALALQARQGAASRSLSAPVSACSARRRTASRAAPEEALSLPYAAALHVQPSALQEISPVSICIVYASRCALHTYRRERNCLSVTDSYH